MKKMEPIPANHGYSQKALRTWACHIRYKNHKKEKEKGLGWIRVWSEGIEVGEKGVDQDDPNSQRIHFEGLACDLYKGNHGHHAKDEDSTR